MEINDLVIIYHNFKNVYIEKKTLIQFVITNCGQVGGLVLDLYIQNKYVKLLYLQGK